MSDTVFFDTVIVQTVLADIYDIVVLLLKGDKLSGDKLGNNGLADTVPIEVWENHLVTLVSGIIEDAVKINRRGFWLWKQEAWVICQELLSDGVYSLNITLNELGEQKTSNPKIVFTGVSEESLGVDVVLIYQGENKVKRSLSEGQILYFKERVVKPKAEVNSI